MNQKIYFDNGSTSWPKAPQVASSMSELLESSAFNINRGNYEGGKGAGKSGASHTYKTPDFFMHRIPDMSYSHRESLIP
ncbi:MAG: hypothetical protein ACLU80_16260 [Dorea sp.]